MAATLTHWLERIISHESHRHGDDGGLYIVPFMYRHFLGDHEPGSIIPLASKDLVARRGYYHPVGSQEQLLANLGVLLYWHVFEEEILVPTLNNEAILPG